MASGTTLTETAQNLLGDGGYDLVLQPASGSATVAEFNSAGQELASQTATLSNVASGGHLTVSAANEFITGSHATITLDTDSGGILQGSSDTVTVDDNVLLSVAGSNNAFTLGSNDTLDLNSGVSETVTSTYNTVNAASGVDVTMDGGGGNTVNAADGNTVTVEGNSQYGWSDTVTLSNGTINVADDSSMEFVGSNNSVTGNDDAHIGIDSGNNNNVTISGENGDVYIEASTGNIVTMTGGVVATDTGVNATINGLGDGITAAAGDTINVGDNGEYGWADTVAMTGGTINVVTDSSIEVAGGNNTITGSTDDQIGIDSGDHNVVSAGAGSDVRVDTGNSTVMTTSNSQVALNTNVVNTSIIGSNDAITGSNGDNLNVTGSSDTIDVSHSTIYLNAGDTNISITGSNDTIHIRSGDTYTISGSNDTVVTDTVLSETNGNTINHFNGASQLIDLASLSYDSSITVTESLNGGHTSGTLTIKDNGTTVDTLTLTNITSIGTFNIRSDGSGGTLLVDPPDASTNAATPNAATASPHDGFKFANVMHEIFSLAPPSSPSVSSNGDQFIFHANNLTQPSFSNGAEASHTAHALIDNFTNTPAHEIAEIMDAAHALPTAPENSYLQALHAHDGFHLA